MFFIVCGLFPHGLLLRQVYTVQLLLQCLTYHIWCILKNFVTWHFHFLITYIHLNFLLPFFAVFFVGIAFVKFLFAVVFFFCGGSVSMMVCRTVSSNFTCCFPWCCAYCFWFLEIFVCCVVLVIKRSYCFQAMRFSHQVRFYGNLYFVLHQKVFVLWNSVPDKRKSSSWWILCIGYLSVREVILNDIHFKPPIANLLRVPLMGTDSSKDVEIYKLKSVWGHFSECLASLPRMFEDIPRNVWRYPPSRLRSSSGIFEDIPWNVCDNIWGHSPECLATFPIPCNVWRHSPKSLRTFQNVWWHSPKENIPPTPCVPRIPSPVPVFLVLY